MSFFQGQPVKIAISCVEAECLNCQECNSDNFDKCIAIKNAHPHIVTGENNEDLNGTTYIKTIWLHESGQEFAFKVGIMSTKKTDIQEVLAVRGLKHKPNHNFDLNKVKVCVQVSVAKEGFDPIAMTFSQTLYNKHNIENKDLKITKLLSDNRSPMKGGKDIMILGNVASNHIQVCFRMPDLGMYLRYSFVHTYVHNTHL
jgi:hypothetical protein